MKKDKANKTKENIHKNHRQRMHEKFRTIGFRGWSDYEILEYMLYNTYSRIDTNPISHRLLDSNGKSIVKLLKNAEEIDLSETVEGVGEKTALYLRSLKAFIDHYRDKQVQEEKTELNAGNIEQYIKAIDFPDDREEMKVICMDKFMRVKCIVEVTETSGATVATTKVDKLINAAVKTKAANVILVHNHPSGYDKVSIEDIDTTVHVEKMLDTFGVYLIDHYVLCGDKVISVKFERAESKYDQAGF